MERADVIIGIDPDVDKSGYAELTTSSRKIKSCSLSFVDLMKRLREVAEEDKFKKMLSFEPVQNNFVIVVEAGYLNKGNWHLKNSDSKRVSSAKGNAAGRNHEVARKIIEMARDYFGLEVVEQRPLAKTWAGRDHKITHEELVYFADIGKKRSTQDERDSCLLCWNYAGFPIKVKPINSK